MSFERCNENGIVEQSGRINKMTNLNKINSTQKTMLADYMKEHPSLARNILPNCAEGRSTAIRLWNELASKLNSVGPPVKDAKLWRKVYADQKYQAKKKLSFNKAAKRKSGGGPYEVKLLTQDERQIIEASGLAIPEEGLVNANALNVSDSNEIYLKEEPEQTGDEFVYSSDDSYILPSFTKDTNNTEQENQKEGIEFQKEIIAKLDKLLSIEERILQMKEEKHEAVMAVKRIELQLKTLELKMLESKNVK